MIAFGVVRLSMGHRYIVYKPTDLVGKQRATLRIRDNRMKKRMALSQSSRGENQSEDADTFPIGRFKRVKVEKNPWAFQRAVDIQSL